MNLKCISLFLPDSITLIQSTEQTREQQSALCKEVPVTTQGGGFVPHPWTMLTNNLDFHAHLPPHHGESQGLFVFNDS